MTNKKVTVVKWIPYDHIDELTPTVGGMGGFFRNGMRWKDYINCINDDYSTYYEALREEIISKALKQGGDWHQEDAHGAPVFSDGVTGSFSYRAWGDLMAAVWSEYEKKDYHYMDFYMQSLVDRD